MNKISVRFLTVFAAAAAAFALVNLSKIGSSPAKDVPPPDESAAPSQSGSSSGSPSSVPGSPGQVGPDQTVSSVTNPNEPAFEWTLERMLLAVPMPMTQEERTFLSSHPPLEKIRDWSQEEFKAYISTPLGLKQAAQEGVRWRELVAMLKKQVKAGSAFLVKPRFDEATGASQPGSPGEISSFDKFDMLDQNQFEAGLKEDSAIAFARLRQWRQEITVLAGQVEKMRKMAAKRGQTDLFEKAISETE